MTLLTLASQSAIRKALLTAAGLDFEAISSGVDETPIKAQMLAQGASPAQVASRLAEAKALAVSAVRPGLVIGADQTLDLEGVLYDKAEDMAQARARLLSLRGRPHQLQGAVALVEDGVVVWRTLSTNTLVVRDFSDAFLDAYLARWGEGLLNSVGCYELEAGGVQLFERIEGDYFAILGLPMLDLLAALRERGALAA